MPVRGESRQGSHEKEGEKVSVWGGGTGGAISKKECNKP